LESNDFILKRVTQIPYRFKFLKGETSQRHNYHPQ
jgi:hypothetical protein